VPGSVAAAAPTTVLPLSLCKAFVHSREYALVENEYRNGESQRSLLVASSRKSWRLAKRLTASAMKTLRDFYDARNGPQQSFYFYDVFETSPKFGYDPTGVATTGRYTVRFEGPWEQSCGMGRVDVNIALVQLA
jgi:hypothetical protein